MKGEKERMSSNQSFRCCFFFKRIFKLRVAEPPDDIKHLFDRYSQNGTMSVDELLRFMIEVQHEKNATIDNAQAIFHSLRHLNMFHWRGLHLDAFFRYLLSEINTPLPPKRVHHDMNAPLAHYYLYTGHNSYLTGNQLSSDSSIEPIIKALRSGVRVIELDLWPDKDIDVKVCHGGTLTSPVDLNKCLHAIKNNAFLTSEYPVIITFEDHLPPHLQAKVAKMVKKTFGRMLFCPESDFLEEFPSPESLKKRVLISTKPPQEYLEAQDSNESRSLSKTRTWSKSSEDSQIETDSYYKQDQVDDTMVIEEENEENTAPEYRRLIAIHAVKLKGGLLEDLLSPAENKARRLSMSEQQLENAIRTHSTDIVRFTQKNLLRVYPKGTRIDSSNYNPYVGWAHGAQMVAFNMQGTGKFLWIMQGMFRANGGCGYVKKPDFLLKVGPENEVFNPNEPVLVKTILKVKIYLGEGWHLDFRHTHFDLYSPPDLFIKVGIAGVPADTIMEKTEKVFDQWIPVWNKEFQFPLTVPELALLRVEAFDYDNSGEDDFAGQTCLPVSELRTGIRAVPLHNLKGDKLRATRILMSFEFV